MKKYKIGGQFSGVGAFDQALKRLGIDYKNIYQAEWDKYARQTYLHNYEEPIYYVKDVHDTPTEEITEKYGSLDLAMFSPPCQAFSLAGKRKGKEDMRGILFFNSLEFIRINKPRYFIFENVKGLLSDDNGKTFSEWVNLLGGKSVNGAPVIFPYDDSVPYHLYWQVLNAKHHGVPQNRERVFLVGIRDDKDNTFRFPPEEHLTKRLKDVLDEEVDEKYYLSERTLKYFAQHKEIHENRGNGFKFNPHTKETLHSNAISTKCGTRQTDPYIKVGTWRTHEDGRGFREIEDGNCPTIPARAREDGSGQPVVRVQSATSKGYEEATEGDSINLSVPNSKTRRGRVGKGVAQTLDTACNQSVVIGAFSGRNPDNPSDRITGSPTQQQLEINESGTSNAITTVQKDNVVIQLNPSKESGGKQPYQQNRVYDPNGVSPALNAGQETWGGNAIVDPVAPCLHGFEHGTNGQLNKQLVKKGLIRRLTPRECFRLMDFDESFTWICSDSQAYKQAGNSIVVNVLYKIIKNLNL